MKNQQDKKDIKLVEHHLDVKRVFVTEEEKARLDYMFYHRRAVRDVLRERLVQDSSWEAGSLDGATHDEVIISLLLGGVSAEQSASQVRHEVDPHGFRVLECLQEALGAIALRHGQEAFNQSLAHIENYISSLESES